MHQTALGGSVKKKTRAFPIPCLGALSAQKLLQLCTSLPWTTGSCASVCRCSSTELAHESPASSIQAIAMLPSWSVPLRVFSEGTPLTLFLALCTFWPLRKCHLFSWMLTAYDPSPHQHEMFEKIPGVISFPVLRQISILVCACRLQPPQRTGLWYIPSFLPQTRYTKKHIAKGLNKYVV